jgi:guanosine-3',5'-bis(diphosphate) 3'-pyrophosphohydrolase
MPQTDAEILLQEVSAYLKPKDVAQVESALAFSRTAHQGQLRQSGAPYVTHPIAVARILTPLHLDAQAIIAALLHDVAEDTHISIEQIAEQFGKPVAELVDGLSKLDKLKFDTVVDAQAENFRKMLMAMARDVRVILIKLADRLHNMRTLDSVSKEKSRRIARETMDIYAPIANRLGLNNLYQELEDLSFKYLYPNRYAVLSKALKVARGNRREVVSKILEAIRQRLDENHIKAEVRGREKHSPSRWPSRRCWTSTASVSWSRMSRRVISRSAYCTACTSPSPAGSRTTSRFPKVTATSRCIPRCSDRSAHPSKCRYARTR